MVAQLHPEVVGTAVGVFIYSVVCLICSALLTWLVWVHHERTSYVAMLGWFTSLSTLASITQQIHTILLWRDIKLEQYHYSVANLGNPELAIAGPSVGLDLVLFYIQFYCYNVQAMLVLVWACALAQSIFKMDAFKPLKRRGPIVAKLFVVFLPVLQMCLLRTSALQENIPAFFVIANIVMAVSLTFGSCLLISILFKYIQTRRAFLSWNVGYGQSDMSNSTTTTAVTLDSANIDTKRSIYDRWLVLRFSIAFVALGIFQVVAILFEIISMRHNNIDYLAGSADLSASRARSDFVLFMSGVSTSLLSFIVFGTTKTFREFMWVKLVPQAIRRRREKTKRLGTPSFANNKPQTSPPELHDPDSFGRNRGGNDDEFGREMGRYTPTDNGFGIRLREMEHDGSIRRYEDEWPILTTAPPKPPKPP